MPLPLTATMVSSAMPGAETYWPETDWLPTLPRAWKTPSAAAAVRIDNRVTRIYKEHKHSTRRIDLAVYAIMAHSVAAAADPGVQLYWYDEVS